MVCSRTKKRADSCTLSFVSLILRSRLRLNSFQEAQSYASSRTRDGIWLAVTPMALTG